MRARIVSVVWGRAVGSGFVSVRFAAVGAAWVGCAFAEGGGAVRVEFGLQVVQVGFVVVRFEFGLPAAFRMVFRIVAVTAEVGRAVVDFVRFAAAAGVAAVPVSCFGGVRGRPDVCE